MTRLDWIMRQTKFLPSLTRASVPSLENKLAVTDPLRNHRKPSPQPVRSPATFTPREEDPRFRLDPWRSPRRLNLSLSPHLLSQLEALAARTGRDVEELMIEALDRKLRELDLHKGDS